MVQYSYIDVQKDLISHIIDISSIEAEDPSKEVAVISKIVSSEYFDDPKLRAIYEIITEAVRNGERVDKAMLALYLEKKGFKWLETDNYLLNCTTVATSKNLAELLRKRAIVHKFSQLAQQAIEDINITTDETNLMGSLSDEIQQLNIELSPPPEKTPEEELEDYKSYVLQEEDEKEESIPSPYPTLNNYISGGFRKEQLITVGARTGVGKTVVATNCTAAACKAGKSVIFFSLEMSKQELYKRLVSSESQIPMSVIRPRSDRDKETIEKITQAFEDIKSNWKLKIVDETDMTIEKIKAEAAKQKQTPEGLDMVVIDYLQLISVRGGRSRQEEVAEISRSCKMMAKQLQVPVMILVQLNRETKDDEDRLPSKADIRESAAIAADSDIILIIHRKYRDESTTPKATFVLDKNRGGPADKHFNVSAVLAKNLFIDDTEQETNTADFGKKEDLKTPETVVDDNDVDWGELFD